MIDEAFSQDKVIGYVRRALTNAKSYLEMRDMYLWRDEYRIPDYKAYIVANIVLLFIWIVLFYIPEVNSLKRIANFPDVVQQ
jgi:surface polysaccharide O-acyltransferase-like enzyme